MEGKEGKKEGKRGRNANAFERKYGMPFIEASVAAGAMESAVVWQVGSTKVETPMTDNDPITDK